MVQGQKMRYVVGYLAPKGGSFDFCAPNRMYAASESNLLTTEDGASSDFMDAKPHVSTLVFTCNLIYSLLPSSQSNLLTPTGCRGGSIQQDSCCTARGT